MHSALRRNRAMTMFRKTIIGALIAGSFPQPSLSLDFLGMAVRGAADGRLTCTGGANGTRMTSAGLIAAATCPRFDFGSPRTNYIRNNTMVGAVAGVIGSGGVLPTNWNFAVATSTGLTRTVVGTGAVDGISYVDLKLSGTAVGAGSVSISLSGVSNNQTIAAPSSIWSGSFYATVADGTLSKNIGNGIFINSYDAVGSFLAAGTGGTLTGGVPGTGSVASQRFKLEGRTLVNAGTVFTNFGIFLTIADAEVINFTLRIGMPQLELSATTTAVIATSGSEVTVAIPKGLLIEEARTNLLLRSAEFDNASWVKTNATVTANGVVAPDGTTTADTIVATGAAGRAAQAIAISAGSKVAVAFWLHRNNVNFGRIRVTSTTDTVSAWFNLAAGTVGATSGTGAEITAVASSMTGPSQAGWYCCTVLLTTATVTSLTCGVIPAQANSGDSVNTDAVDVWGAQGEVGAFATSYIPTVAAAVTRTVDAVSLGGAEFLKVFGLAAGTLQVKGTIVGGTATNFPYWLAATSATPNNDSIGLLWTAATGQARGGIRAAAASSVDISAGAGLSAGSSFNTALSYSTSTAQFALGGTLGARDNSVTLPTCDRLLICGAVGFQTAPSAWIKSASLFRRAFPDATLQRLTAAA